MLSENKEFVVCAVETGKNFIYTNEFYLFYLKKL